MLGRRKTLGCPEGMRLLDKKRELLAMQRMRYPSSWLSTFPRVPMLGCAPLVPLWVGKRLRLHLTIKARTPGRGHGIVLPGKNLLGFESKGNRVSILGSIVVLGFICSIPTPGGKDYVFQETELSSL